MQVYAESFIYSTCVPEMLNSVSHFYADQSAIIKHCVKIVCPQHTIYTNMRRDMHASDAISQWLRRWRVVKCCSAECLAGAVAKYSNDVKRR